MPRRLIDLLLVVLSALLLTLPYHFESLYLLGFIAFIPFCFAISHRSRRDAFKLAYVFGWLFFMGMGYWLSFVNLLGLIVLSSYLAIYFGAFGYLSASFLGAEADRSQSPEKRLLIALCALPALWVVLEAIRGWFLTGLPWALLSYTQWKNTAFIQMSEWVGAYGVSFWILWVNLLLYFILQILFSNALGSRSLMGDLIQRARWTTILTVILVGFVGFFYLHGFWSIHHFESRISKGGNKASLHVSVLQGNIPQDQKWDKRIKVIIFEKYKRLTLMSALQKSDLIIWPETSFPGYLDDEPELAKRLGQVIRQAGTSVLVGAPTIGDLEDGFQFYNSAILFNPNGREKTRHHKVHLVPFGEYIPFEWALGFLRTFFDIGHFSPGEDKTIFEIHKDSQTIRFASLICYEDIFPGLVRRYVQNGTQFLINMTNDAWFGKTSAPYQHAQASLFRAIENRVPVIRSTNTGLSCVISPTGKILDTVSREGEEIFVTGHLIHALRLESKQLPKSMTLYTRFGDFFVYVCAFIYLIAARNRKKFSPE